MRNMVNKPTDAHWNKPLIHVIFFLWKKMLIIMTLGFQTQNDGQAAAAINEAI